VKIPKQFQKLEPCMVTSLIGSSIFWFCSNCAGKSYINGPPYHVLTFGINIQLHFGLPGKLSTLPMQRCGCGHEKVVK